jgi:hypothetical protein
VWEEGERFWNASGRSSPPSGAGDRGGVGNKRIEALRSAGGVGTPEVSRGRQGEKADAMGSSREGTPGSLYDGEGFLKM